MKGIQYLLAAAAAFCLLAACTRDIQVAMAAYDDAIGAGGTDARAEVSCAMQYLTGGASQEVMDRINGAIVENHLLFDEADGSTDVPAAVRTWVDETLASCGFDEEEITEENAWAYHWTFERSGEFSTACKSRKLQTFTGSYNDYTGGSHGQFGIGCDVFDLTTGEIVSEEDLFVEDYFSPLCDLLEEAVAENVSEEDQEMLFGMPEPNGNFSVSEAGITWVFNPYEIAAYASGVIELPIPWAKLKPYLQPRWR